MSLLDPTDWTGTCGLRLYPTDDFATDVSEARLTPVAGGAALALDYTWRHPERGAQAGHLVLGRPDDDGTVTAAWTDTFHQAPEIRTLTGVHTEATDATPAPSPDGDPVTTHPVSGDGVAVAMGYGGWGWTVAVRLQGGTLAMVMQNVVPEGVPGAVPGAYDVMRAAWTRPSA